MATHDIDGAVSGSSRHATIREQLNRTTNPVNPEYNYPGAKELKDNLKLNPDLLKPSQFKPTISVKRRLANLESRNQKF